VDIQVAIWLVMLVLAIRIETNDHVRTFTLGANLVPRIPLALVHFGNHLLG
jgi:hypothetical protein